MKQPAKVTKKNKSDNIFVEKCICANMIYLTTYFLPP